jgi:alpha-amylase
MPSVCFYFQVHQPDRLRRYRALDIGCSRHYFDADKNQEIARKVAAKCYVPMGERLLRLIDRHQGRFKVAFSLSGIVLDQLEESAPEALAMFQRLAATGCVELLAETYFHSLSFVHDRDEFDRQVAQHQARVEELFGRRATVFRNTELIFNNALAQHLEARGFTAVLAEGVDRVLDWRSPNHLYTSVSAPRLPVLLKNYRLSDDIAFRFSNRQWEEYPLTAPKLARWIDAVNGDGTVVNLFMDYETFGEHQWAETGVFEFMDRLPAEVLANPDNDFKTPSEVAAGARAGTIDVHDFTSWADVERDLSAWLGNAMQHAAAKALYGMREAVYATRDASIVRDWQRLTTSDHLYYMCTKWFSDGDVHKYFNPYESPYEAYIAFMNVLNDLALRIGDRDGARRIVEEPHLLMLQATPRRNARRAVASNQ